MFKFLVVSFATSFIFISFQAKASANVAICSRLFTSNKVISKTNSRTTNSNLVAKHQPNSILDWNFENGLFPDISKLNPLDLVSAQDQSIAEVRASIAQIKKIKNPTFENVFYPLEYADQKAKKFDHIYGALDSGFKNADFKKVEKEILAKMDKFENEIWTDQALFEKVDEVYKKRDSLSTDQRRLVESYRRNFVNNGLNLKGAERERFVKIKEELTELASTFGNNYMESSAQFKYLVKDRNELQGLSQDLVDLLQQKAKEAGEDGYLLTLEPGIFTEVMKTADNSELRKTLLTAKYNVAYKSGITDNSEVIKKIASLRQEMAQLLGYKHYSEYALKDKMAHDIETVRNLVEKLIATYKPQAIREEQELKDFVKSQTGSDKLEAWDRSYWVEKLLKEKYEFDESVIKEYLEYDKVQNAAFTVAGKLYGLKFIERSDLPKYDSSTQVFEVRDSSNQLMAYFVVDPFARRGLKRSGAWASRLFPTYNLEGKRQIPVVTNSMNFTKAMDGNPQLLTVDEGITLFHEFGHALHTILSQARYPSQAGTAVARDFVELPSQFFENFFYEKDVLKMFAYHYKTKELIPDQYIQSIKRVSQFRSATAALGQIGYILLDLAWHDGSALTLKGSIYEIERNILKPIKINPNEFEMAISTTFSHIFDGGYSSAYYSYKWAEILDADAFSIFKKEGLFNIETAKRFLVILQSGGSKDPQELYRDFAGRDPSPEAMFKRDGVIEGKPEK